MEKLYPIRYNPRLTKEQRAKLTKEAKRATKEEKKKISDAEVMRRLIDKYLS